MSCQNDKKLSFTVSFYYTRIRESLRKMIEIYHSIILYWLDPGQLTCMRTRLLKLHNCEVLKFHAKSIVIVSLIMDNSPDLHIQSKPVNRHDFPKTEILLLL